MGTEEQDWANLAVEVKRARESTGRTQVEAAVDAGISDQVWSLVERAAQTSYRPRTLSRIAGALGWTPGSIEDVLAGGSPTEVGTRIADLNVLLENARSAIDNDQVSSALTEIARIETELAATYRLVANPRAGGPESLADIIERQGGTLPPARDSHGATLIDHEARIRALENLVQTMATRISADHAMAAESGEDPSDTERGPAVGRPSPAVGMDDDDLGA